MNSPINDSDKKLIRYSDHEKQILYALFKEYGDIIDRHKRIKHKSKRSELQEAWQEILTRFNNHRSTTQRNLKQIQKFWLNARLRNAAFEGRRSAGGDHESETSEKKYRMSSSQSSKHQHNDKASSDVAADSGGELRSPPKWKRGESNDYEEADDEDEESNDGREESTAAVIGGRTHEMKEEVSGENYAEEQEENDDEEEEVEEEHHNGSVDAQYDERSSSQPIQRPPHHHIPANRNGAYAYSTNHAPIVNVPTINIRSGTTTSAEPISSHQQRIFEGYTSTSPPPPPVIHAQPTSMPTLQISNATVQIPAVLDNYQYEAQSNLLRLQDNELRVKEMHLRYEQQRTDLLKSQEELKHLKEMNRLRAKELNLKVLILEQQLKSRTEGTTKSRRSKS